MNWQPTEGAFMTIKRRSLFMLFLLCLRPTPLSAESKPLELRWTELAPMVAGHSVELNLADSGTVNGEAISIREDTLVLDVKKSTGIKRYGKGNAAIPRSAIRLITLQRSHGTWGRSMGTTLGIVTGLGVGGYSAAHTDSGGAAVAVLVAVTSGMAVIGYYTGRGLDRRTTRITILP